MNKNLVQLIAVISLFASPSAFAQGAGTTSSGSGTGADSHMDSKHHTSTTTTEKRKSGKRNNATNNDSSTETGMDKTGTSSSSDNTVDTPPKGKAGR